MKPLQALHILFFVIPCYKNFEYNSADEMNCNVDAQLVREIANHEFTVNKIADFLISGSAKGDVYNELGKFVDTFGHRLTGTMNLEKSIDYAVHLLKEKGLDNVHTEEVEVPRWERCKESARLIFPLKKKLSILGLGSSVETSVVGITAEVLVVKSFDELKVRAAEAKGKIVVFNQDFTNYGETVLYRTKGASRAAEVGAVASLIRSVATFSINSPHTGQQKYDENVKKIPTACITVEDAEMLWRMANRNNKTKIIIYLYMATRALSPAKSRNTIAELKGQMNPKQIVQLSGHIDSWDVGQGAMDDAAGAFISWYALHVLKQLDLIPQRTIQAVLWTAEEVGLIGAKSFYKQHKAEMDDYDLVMESDIGTFRPTGLSFTGSNETLCILKEILKLLDFMNASNIVMPSEGSDISVFEGIPQASLLNSNDRYFWFHHSEGDTLEVIDSDVLDLCTVLWASVAFVVANISSMLPRGSIGSTSL